jgi:hypothetical protein
MVCLGFGITDGLIPEVSALWVGIALDRVGAFMARSFAAGFIGIGLVCWFARDAEESRLRQAILLACFIADTGAFIAALSAQLSGLMNALGWFLVAVWLLLLSGFG